ncbi:MAG: MFS transporter [Candidatus Methanomethyliaceae archaeon]
MSLTQEALSLLKSWRIRITLASCLAYALYYWGRYNYSGLGPFVKSALAWPAWQWGVFASAMTAGYAIGQFINGALIDYYGPRKVYSIGAVGSGLANIATGLFPFFPSMSTSWFLNGYFQASGSPSYGKLFTCWFPPKARGLPNALNDAARLIGSLTIVPLAAYIATVMGWQWGFIIPGIILFPAAVMIWFLIRDQPKDCGIKGCDWIPETEKKSLVKEMVTAYTFVWRRWRFLSHSVAYGMSQFTRFGIYTWIPIYAVEVLGFNPIAGAALLSVSPLAGAIATVVFGWLADKLGFGSRRILLGLGLTISAISLLVIGWYPHLPTAAYVGLVFLVGAFTEGLDTVYFLVVMDKFGKAGKAGTAYGSLNAVGKVFGTFSSAILGFVLTISGWISAFTLLAILGFIGTVMMLPVTAAWIRGEIE